MKRLVLLLAVLTSTGCVVIEKKTLVMVVPPNSNEVHLCYVFEGISVLNSDRSSLGRAIADLDGLRKDDFGFFGSIGDLDSPYLRLCRFDKLRFFADPTRNRSLCADRRMTIRDRGKFAKQLNKDLGESLANALRDTTDEEVQQAIKTAGDNLAKPDSRKEADALGMGALQTTADGLLSIARDFDAASIACLRKANTAGFEWIRFEPDAVRIVLPITADCAKQIVADPKSADRLKPLRTLVEPIDLTAGPDGLSIVVGKPGQAIRFTYTDARQHRPDDEAKLAEHVGSPKPIVLDGGKHVTAEWLVERFCADKMPKR